MRRNLQTTGTMILSKHAIAGVRFKDGIEVLEVPENHAA
jgi:hypothetical protein